jgi:hypothetical protein
LTEVLRTGARALLAQAIEAEGISRDTRTPPRVIRHCGNDFLLTANRPQGTICALRERPAAGRHDAPRTVGYCRVSTEEQSANGRSLAVQESQLRGWGQTTERAIAVVIEAGVSGAVPCAERPQQVVIKRIRRLADRGLSSHKISDTLRERGSITVLNGRRHPLRGMIR